MEQLITLIDSAMSASRLITTVARPTVTRVLGNGAGPGPTADEARPPVVGSLSCLEVRSGSVGRST
jgi:hypothetical protein